MMPGYSRQGIDNKPFIKMMGIRIDKGYELSQNEIKRLYHMARAYVIWKCEDEPDDMPNNADTLRDAMTERPKYRNKEEKFVAEWQAKNPRAPIYLNFAMNIHFSGQRAEEELGTKHWNSSEGTKVRHWLVAEGLAIANNHYRRYPKMEDGGSVNVWEKVTYELTDKGRAWVEHACGTPLPVEQTEVVKNTKWVRG